MGLKPDWGWGEIRCTGMVEWLALVGGRRTSAGGPEVAVCYRVGCLASRLL